MNKIYIAGPMSGYEEYNIGSFFAAADFFEELGWEVYNPAKETGKKYGMEIYTDREKLKDRGFTIREIFSRYTDWICNEATHIYMLSGWEKSLGARAEHALATVLGLKIMYEQGV